MSVKDTPEPREAGWRAPPPLKGDGLPVVWASRLLHSYAAISQPGRDG